MNATDRVLQRCAVVGIYVRQNAKFPWTTPFVADTFVSTLLRGLEEKKAVDHQTEGRTFTFYPIIHEAEFKQSATQDLLNVYSVAVSRG